MSFTYKIHAELMRCSKKTGKKRHQSIRALRRN
jgi:hypothetical protein